MSGMPSIVSNTTSKISEWRKRLTNRKARHPAPMLPKSPSIAPMLPESPSIAPMLPISPSIAPMLPISPSIAPMAPKPQLPDEIWTRIASHLAHKDATALLKSGPEVRTAAETRIWRSINLIKPLPRPQRQGASVPGMQEWHTRSHFDILKLLHMFKRAKTRRYGSYVRHLTIDHRLTTKNNLLLIELVKLVAPGLTRLTIKPQSPHLLRSLANQGHVTFFDFLLSSDVFKNLTTLDLTVDYGVLPEEIVAVAHRMKNLKTLSVGYVEHKHGDRLSAHRQDTFKPLAPADLNFAKLTTASFKVVHQMPLAFLQLIQHAPRLSALDLEVTRTGHQGAPFEKWHLVSAETVRQVIVNLSKLRKLTWELSELSAFIDDLSQDSLIGLETLIVSDSPLPVFGWRPEIMAIPPLPRLRSLVLRTTGTYAPARDMSQAELALFGQTAQRLTNPFLERIQAAPELMLVLIQNRCHWSNSLSSLGQAVIVRKTGPNGALITVKFDTCAVPDGPPRFLKANESTAHTYAPILPRIQSAAPIYQFYARAPERVEQRMVWVE